MDKVKNDYFAWLCLFTAIFSCAVLCLSTQTFADYNKLAAISFSWLGKHNASANSGLLKSVLNEFTTTARFFQFSLLLLWSMYSIMLLWVLAQRQAIGARTKISMLLLWVLLFATGYYVISVWTANNLLILDGCLMLTVLLCTWLSAAQKVRRFPPNYRYRVLRVWVFVAFGLVLLQCGLGATVAIMHPGICVNWPYCASLLHNSNINPVSLINSQSPSYWHSLATGVLVTGQVLLYRYAAAVSMGYLLVFAAFLILVRQFAPLRWFGIALFVVAFAQFILGLRVGHVAEFWQSIVMQQALLLILLVLLVLVVYRVFAREAALRFSQ